VRRNDMGQRCLQENQNQNKQWSPPHKKERAVAQNCKQQRHTLPTPGGPQSRTTWGKSMAIEAARPMRHKDPQSASCTFALSFSAT
jgi:hypothetical protein